MDDEKKCECRDCGHTETADGDAPECCGKPMVIIPLDVCTSAGAEHARPMDDEEPCDDSRAG